MKLYRETPCEHGKMQAHGVRGVIHGEGIPECYGGSRKKVVIGYEAAGQQRYEVVQQMSKGIAAFEVDWHDLPADERDEWIAEVKPYVDAAFKSAGFTKTFTSEKEHRE